MSEASLGLRLGVDVGGTNTDAILLDASGLVVGKAKTPTTTDLSEGIAIAVGMVLKYADVAEARVTHAMLGTTHATNAILQRRGLDRVAVVRIGAPATLSIPVAHGWPRDLYEAMICGSTVVPGGFEYDGREIVPFDPDPVRRFFAELPERPAGVAVTGVFSSTRPDQEQAVADIAREVLGDVHVSLSHEIGGLGLIERENATILNAGLHSAAREALRAFTEATTAAGISTGRTLFAQNDGTLMSIRQAMRLPVLTIGSGPSNSIRGAAELAGARAGIVVDVGGTTTDIGVLVHGLPRESYGGRIIGGVATNFRIPDVITVPIGGGTIIRRADGRVRLGPDSVGKDLWSRALVFGGDTPTLTDAAVLAGRLELGDPSSLGEHADLLREALAESDDALAAAVELAKSSRAREDVVVVGGGRSLFPPIVPGTDQAPSPADADVANAVGAASASIGAEAEAVIALDGTREAEMDLIRREAADRAVAAGADPALVAVIDVVEVPLAYLSPPAARLRVRVAAPLAATTSDDSAVADHLSRSSS